MDWRKQDKPKEDESSILLPALAGVRGPPGILPKIHISDVLRHLATHPNKMMLE